MCVWYYRFLAALRLRAADGAATWCEFCWLDAVSHEKASRAELSYEIACVLANLGAALSHAGAKEDRAEASGLRAACQYFQQAAGAFDALSAVLGGAAWGAPTPDLHPKAAEGWKHLMLAQAQLCFYQKAVDGGMKPAVVAKLAAQVAASCSTCSSCLQHRDLGGHLESWALLVDAQRHCFDGWAQYHMAAEHDAAHEYGPQVARLRCASGSLAEAGRACERIAAAAQPECLAELLGSLAAATGTIAAKAQQAAAMNDAAYNERVPDAALLEPIGPKCIVKPAPVDETVRATTHGHPAPGTAAGWEAKGADGGGDPLRRLVPAAVEEAASVYSAQRDEALRELLGAHDFAEQSRAADLATMDLPGALDAVYEGCDASGARHAVPIPEHLAQSLKRVHACYAEGALSALLGQLAESAKSADSLAMSVDALLEVEEGADQQLHTTHGERWRALPSSHLNGESREELGALKEKLAVATAVDASLRAALEQQRVAMEPLAYSLADLQEQVPSGSSIADLKCTQDVRSLLTSVLATADFAAELLGQARGLTDAGVIVDELVHRGDGAGGSSEAVIAEALSRLSPLSSSMHEALSEQAALLSALRDANEAFTQARFDDPLLQATHRYFDLLQAAVTAYTDLESQITQGVAFYEKVRARRAPVPRRCALPRARRLAPASPHPPTSTAAVPRRPPCRWPTRWRRSTAASSASRARAPSSAPSCSARSAPRLQLSARPARACRSPRAGRTPQACPRAGRTPQAWRRAQRGLPWSPWWRASRARRPMARATARTWRASPRRRRRNAQLGSGSRGAPPTSAPSPRARPPRAQPPRARPPVGRAAGTRPRARPRACAHLARAPGGPEHGPQPWRK